MFITVVLMQKEISRSVSFLGFLFLLLAFGLEKPTTKEDKAPESDVTSDFNNSEILSSKKSADIPDSKKVKESVPKPSTTSTPIATSTPTTPTSTSTSTTPTSITASATASSVKKQTEIDDEDIVAKVNQRRSEKLKQIETENEVTKQTDFRTTLKKSKNLSNSSATASVSPDQMSGDSSQITTPPVVTSPLVSTTTQNTRNNTTPPPTTVADKTTAPKEKTVKTNALESVNKKVPSDIQSDKEPEVKATPIHSVNISGTVAPKKSAVSGSLFYLFIHLFKEGKKKKQHPWLLTRQCQLQFHPLRRIPKQ